MYERFDGAPALRASTQDRMAEIYHRTTLQRMDRLEHVMTRMERRLKVTAIGLLAVVMSQLGQVALVLTP
ncbi:MAG: hypothetical protein AAF755_09440 [Pseudomonadota bacterium]